jgi:hypothetical protein
MLDLKHVLESQRVRHPSDYILTQVVVGVGGSVGIRITGSVGGVGQRIACGVGVRVSGRAECGVSGVPGRVVAVSCVELLSGLLILNLLGSEDDGGQSQQNDQALHQFKMIKFIQNSLSSQMSI